MFFLLKSSENRSFFLWFQGDRSKLICLFLVLVLDVSIIISLLIAELGEMEDEIFRKRQEFEVSKNTLIEVDIFLESLAIFSA